MRKEREALLVATLAGLVIVAAAAVMVQPGIAGRAVQPSLQISAVAVPVGASILTQQST